MKSQLSTLGPETPLAPAPAPTLAPALVLAPLLLAASLCACSSSSSGAAADAGAGGTDAAGSDAGNGGTCTQAPLPEGGPVQVTGTVVSAADDGGLTPVPNAMVAVEYGGLYIPWCDLAQGSPYYVFGAVTDDAGIFTVAAQGGKLGFHGFATGQYYSRAPIDTATGTSVQLVLSAQPSGQTRPSITGAAFSPSPVASGAQVTLTATVAAGSASDPLSDETILVEPTHSWAIELDPPSLGKKDDFPDGVWSRTFAAPAEAGHYVYWLSATTAGCVTSDVVTIPLDVQ